MIKRKEEATVAAREEIKAGTLREMQLQSEVKYQHSLLRSVVSNRMLIVDSHNEYVDSDVDWDNIVNDDVD